ncbi:hypothetical protein M885DRAFT_511008 [Pelagophyceae sp. CCMP2097]|nr:hypothetical protein M885DRAFT_511008 [Pelagophyceae sp. CCMP2097]|mmetsp:Transcript_10298/g.36298  ORF Transcript_10298/g.36298 Transcript_10298/m.36298 type:complete len:254 (+) Transcript_10298:1333-2094(+)
MTLRNVIVLAASGLVLFAKDFFGAVAQPRLLGSLLTAMTEFSLQTTAMKPAFIELSSVAVTIVRDDVAKLLCALVHDRTDSAAFGRLIATEILTAFVEEFSVERLRTPLSMHAHNLNDFHTFDGKVAGVIQNSVRPVLQKLQSQRGVTHALLVTDDSISRSGGDVDQLAVLASLEAVMAYSETIFAFARDQAKHMSFDAAGERRILLWRIEDSVLLVCVDKSVSCTCYSNAIEHACMLLRQLCSVTRNMNYSY